MKIRSKLAKAVLYCLEGATGTGVVLYDMAANPGFYQSDLMDRLERYTIYQTVNRLRKNGFIKTIKEKDENKIILKLTQKGKYQIEIERILENEKWDGKWRLVIFDIPEKKRRLRNTLRQRLKEWGFKYWQKSLWVSKKELEEPLRKFIDELGLSDWVLVAVTDNIGNPTHYTTV